jgi:hypothetical protein
MRAPAFFRNVTFALALSLGAMAGVASFAGCADEERPREKPRDGGRRNETSEIGTELDAEVDASADGLDGGVSPIPDVMDVPEVSIVPDVVDVSQPPVAFCNPPVKSAEPIPARSVVMSMDNGGSTEIEVFVGSELFGRFYNACGSCHVDANFGGLKLSQVDFKPGSTRAGQNLLDRMITDDPRTVMPPVASGGSINSQRKAGDPVIQLIALYTRWMQAGQPADVFKIPRDAPPPDANSYLMPPERGLALTNIGDCVPSPGLVGMDAVAAKIAELDRKFEALAKAPPGSNTSVPERIGLPERLSETDLFALDTATLARHRVLA